VFYRFINEKMVDLAAVIVPCIPGILGKKSSVEYFTRTRTEELGKSLEEAMLEGQDLEKAWERIRALFDELESWYAKSKGAFLVGDEPSFGDFTLAGYLQVLKIVQGEHSDDWKKMSIANNGRWVKLLRDLEKYASVDN